MIPVAASLSRHRGDGVQIGDDVPVRSGYGQSYGLTADGLWHVVEPDAGARTGLVRAPGEQLNPMSWWMGDAAQRAAGGRVESSSSPARPANRRT